MALIVPAGRRVATGGPAAAPEAPAGRRSDALAWFAAAGLGLAGLCAALLTTAPRGPAVAAVFPPWWTPSRSVAAAAEAGDVSGTGALRSVVVVSSDRAGLGDRLRAVGALLILSAAGPLGCRSAPATEATP